MLKGLTMIPVCSFFLWKTKCFIISLRDHVDVKEACFCYVLYRWGSVRWGLRRLHYPSGHCSQHAHNCEYNCKLFIWIVKRIDWRCENIKQVSEWKATFVPFDRSWLPLSENPDHHPPQNEPFSQKMHLKIPLLSGVWNCQILNQVVESQLFTSSWNRFHQWLPEIKLIQTSAFFSFLFPVSQLESESGFKFVTQLANCKKRPVFSLIVADGLVEVTFFTLVFVVWGVSAVPKQVEHPPRLHPVLLEALDWTFAAGSDFWTSKEEHVEEVPAAWRLEGATRPRNVSPCDRSLLRFLLAWLILTRFSVGECCWNG